MTPTLRTLAALLGYPSAELKAHVPELREALRADRALSGKRRDALAPLLDRLEREDLLELQSEYTDLFDRSRALSLHLFEHVHGESRERGQAMVDLAGQYAARGLLLAPGELPDFVPVFVEFASELPADEARELLAEPVHVFAALAERLSERGSPYAGVFQSLLALSAERPDARALEELRENVPPDDAAHIDELWEERPVTFTRPAADEWQPIGMVGRVRSAGQAIGHAVGQAADQALGRAFRR